MTITAGATNSVPLFIGNAYRDGSELAVLLPGESLLVQPGRMESGPDEEEREAKMP